MNQDTAGTVELHTSGGRAAVDVDCSDDLYQILLRAFRAAIHGEGDLPSPGLKACSLSRSPSQPSNPPPKAGPSKYPSCTNRKEITNV